MPKFVIGVVLTVSLTFLLTGGAKALVAFWLIIGILLVPAALICGVDKLLKRKKVM